MNKILIIGHQGFVGSGLHEYFAAKTEVVGWGRKENLFSLTAKKLAELGVDVLVNCAVVTERRTKNFIPGSPSDEINVQGALHLAKILKGTSVGWIQISTKDVFGDVYNQKDVEEGDSGFRPKFLVDDNQPFNPQTIYAKSKLMAEFIAESHARAAVIRLSSCYTPHDHPRANWMVNMVKQISRGETVTLANGGLQFRDPLHVADLGRLIESVVEKKRWGLKMNAGGGLENIISVAEFARLIDPRVKMNPAAGGDFGFAFSNRLATEGGHWRPVEKIREFLPQLISQVQGELKTV